MFTDIIFNNKLNRTQLNVIFNLAEKLADNDELQNLTEAHPVSNMYINLSKGMSRDLDSEFEYSMIAELINNSIFNEVNDSFIQSKFIKELSLINDQMNLKINIGKLSKYLL